MIETVGDMLTELVEAEKAILKIHPNKHGPTIGAMHEELARDFLAIAMPDGIKLHIVSGFIVTATGLRSGQIDCMLVRELGERLHDRVFECDIEDVVAVFEIKKTLYGRDLVDAFRHMSEVRALEIEHLRLADKDHMPMTPSDWAKTQQAMEQTTGIQTPHFGNAIHQLHSTLHEHVLRALMMESWGILRVIFGYHGYKNEAKYRTVLANEIVETLGSGAYKPGAFPQLIVSGGNSLCKMNGQPYVAPLDTTGWPFIQSTDANPIKILLEYLWARLSREQNVTELMGIEVPAKTSMHKFLTATYLGQVGGSVQWAYTHVGLP